MDKYQYLGTYSAQERACYLGLCNLVFPRDRLTTDVQKRAWGMEKTIYCLGWKTSRVITSSSHQIWIGVIPSIIQTRSNRQYIVEIILPNHNLLPLERTWCTKNLTDSIDKAERNWIVSFHYSFPHKFDGLFRK
ncbi:unnamed protein product [Thlaspi arvense]|uniref:Uncharacterized protein n=1 Tax=Thlaspi arvense TaxID=13288 RepID=A0AAU9SDH3_THLAR|nr:unnamed protein product [Thlaspi arvense]